MFFGGMGLWSLRALHDNKIGETLRWYKHDLMLHETMIQVPIRTTKPNFTSSQDIWTLLYVLPTQNKSCLVLSCLANHAAIR